MTDGDAYFGVRCFDALFKKKAQVRRGSELIMDTAGHHPYLQVGKLVAWERSLGAALERARGTHRRVLLVHGRATCGGTRAMVEKTIAKEEIADFLNDHFVALAGDADAPDPEIAVLIAGLPKHEPTPVCVYLDATGRVVHSTAGGRPPAVFLNDMTDAIMKK